MLPQDNFETPLLLRMCDVEEEKYYPPHFSTLHAVSLIGANSCLVPQSSFRSGAAELFEQNSRGQQGWGPVDPMGKRLSAVAGGATRDRRELRESLRHPVF